MHSAAVRVQGHQESPVSPRCRSSPSCRSGPSGWCGAHTPSPCVACDCAREPVSASVVPSARSDAAAVLTHRPPRDACAVGQRGRAAKILGHQEGARGRVLQQCARTAVSRACAPGCCCARGCLCARARAIPLRASARGEQALRCRPPHARAPAAVGAAAASPVRHLPCELTGRRARRNCVGGSEVQCPAGSGVAPPSPSAWYKDRVVEIM